MSEYTYDIRVRGEIAEYVGSRGAVTDNTSYMIHFDLQDDSWDRRMPKYLVCNTKRGALPRVAFTGNDVAMPRLYKADGLFLQVGIVQGDQHTTTAAIVPIIPSCLIDGTAPELPSGTVVDSSITETSTNPVTSAAIYAALAGKQDALTAGDGIVIEGSVISATAVDPTDISLAEIANIIDSE